MNAGAYGGEMKDVLESVTVLTGEGKIIELGRNELELGYRTSVIAKKGYIVLGAVLKLERGDGEKIKTYMDELKEKRVTKQPLEYPSAGSTFKRPEGYFAGKLIQDAGLSGYYGTDETGTDPREGEFRRGSGTGSEEIRGRIR